MYGRVVAGRFIMRRSPKMGVEEPLAGTRKGGRVSFASTETCAMNGAFQWIFSLRNEPNPTQRTVFSPSELRNESIKGVDAS